jgi:hypothetical protein
MEVCGAKHPTPPFPLATTVFLRGPLIILERWVIANDMMKTSILTGLSPNRPGCLTAAGTIGIINKSSLKRELY